MNPQDVSRRLRRIAAEGDPLEMARLDMGLPKLAMLMKVAAGVNARVISRIENRLADAVRGTAKQTRKSSIPRSEPLTADRQMTLPLVGKPPRYKKGPPRYEGNQQLLPGMEGEVAGGAAGAAGAAEAGGRGWGRALWALPAVGIGAYGLSQVAAMPGEISSMVSGGGGGHAMPAGSAMGMVPQARGSYAMDPQTRRYYEMMQMAQQYGYPVY